MAALLIAPLAAGAQPASLVRDIDPRPPDPAVSIATPIDTFPLAAGPELYFTAATEASGSELWRTDGTPLGTRQIADLCPGPCGSSPQLFNARGNVALFATRSSEPGALPWHQVWRTDGTRAGTYTLTPAGLDFVYPPLYWDDEAAYFALCDRAFGGARHCALWRSDGTLPGTWRIVGPAAGGEILAVRRAGGSCSSSPATDRWCWGGISG